MDIRRDHEAEIAAPDQLQITMGCRAPPQLAIHGLAQQIEAFSLKLLPFFGRPIRPPSIKASLPPRMLFHLATELLFLLDTARLPSRGREAAIIEGVGILGGDFDCLRQILEFPSS